MFWENTDANVHQQARENTPHSPIWQFSADRSRELVWIGPVLPNVAQRARVCSDLFLS